VRVTFTAFLEKAQIPIQIDIGFGDAIRPGPVETDYPTLLDLPSPRLLTYPREAVVSEKLEAMVKLGIANTRMKDFHEEDLSGHALEDWFGHDGRTRARENIVYCVGYPLDPRTQSILPLQAFNGGTGNRVIP